MTHTATISKTAATAWPIDTPDRVLGAMAGSEGSCIREIAQKSGVAAEIVHEWLTNKVKQGLLLFNESEGTYRSLCHISAVAQVTPRAVAV